MIIKTKFHILNGYAPPDINIEDECSVCYEKYKNIKNVYKLECGHIFHKGCLYNAIKNIIDKCSNFRCPYCRKNISEEAISLFISIFNKYTKKLIKNIKSNLKHIKYGKNIYVIKFPAIYTPKIGFYAINNIKISITGIKNIKSINIFGFDFKKISSYLNKEVYEFKSITNIELIHAMFRSSDIEIYTDDKAELDNVIIKLEMDLIENAYRSHERDYYYENITHIKKKYNEYYDSDVFTFYTYYLTTGTLLYNHFYITLNNNKLYDFMGTSKRVLKRDIIEYDENNFDINKICEYLFENKGLNRMTFKNNTTHLYLNRKIKTAADIHKFITYE